MPVILCRHGERLDYTCKPKWTLERNESAWDSPLTQHGKDQAFHTGKAIVQHIEQFNLPPVGAIYCSPLVRCVETAHNIVKGMNSDQQINVDTRLAETVCESWYRSWAIKNVSDSTWGGPPGYENGTPLDTSTLKAEALVNVNELYKSNETLQQLTDAPVNMKYERIILEGSLCYGTYESELQTVERVGGFAEIAQQQHPNETVILVSHGGPSGACYKYLMEQVNGKAPMFGYTATSVFKESERENESSGENPVDVPSSTSANEATIGKQLNRLYKWDCVLSADVSHLGNVNVEELGFAATGSAE